MPQHPAKTTELSAVNTMLEVIGETPIDSLTDLLPADAATARNILDETSATYRAKAGTSTASSDIRSRQTPKPEKS